MESSVSSKNDAENSLNAAIEQLKKKATTEPSQNVVHECDELVSRCHGLKGTVSLKELDRMERAIEHIKKDVAKSINPRATGFKFKSRAVQIPTPNSQPSRAQKVPTQTHEIHNSHEISRADSHRSNCVMHETELDSVHLEDVRFAIIFLEKVNTSVHLSGIENCAIITNCHQFRIHNSSSVHIFISGCANPVMENCTDLTFGVNGTEHWNDISDFSWLQPGQSPNWSETQLKFSGSVSESTLQQWRDGIARKLSPIDILRPSLA